MSNNVTQLDVEAGAAGADMVMALGTPATQNETLDAIAAHPRLLERPIAIAGDRAVIGRPPERDLDIYYEQNVIGGPGSFLVPAHDFPDFARAVRTKLVREIS